MTELRKLKATIIFTIKGLYEMDALKSGLKDAIEVDFLYADEEVISVEMEELDMSLGDRKELR